MNFFEREIKFQENERTLKRIYMIKIIIINLYETLRRIDEYHLK